MAGTLRDDLASLKIDRRGPASNGRSHAPAREGGGIGPATVLLWLIPIGLLTATGAYAYHLIDRVRSQPEVSIGLVQAMTTGEAEKLLSAKGYLKSRQKAMIGATLPGRVERMFVEEGSRVKKGQVLAVLEHDDLKALLESRRAMLQRNEAELRETRVDLKEKEREARRAIRLHMQKTVALEEVEKANAARDMAEARVGAIEASLRLTRANIQETEETIRKMHLFAPFDGTVVEKQGEEGEVITPSAMSASIGRSAVVTMANLKLMEVETDVAETLLSKVAIGQPAEVSVSAVPSKHYRGRLRQIIPMGDRTRGTVKVQVEILDPDEHLFPELVATVHFLPAATLKDPNASRSYVFVPKAALVEQGGKTYVWVVDLRSKVHRRAIETAAVGDDLARVTSGVESGESVVLNPPRSLRDDLVVKVTE